MWALTDVTMSNIETKQEKVPVTLGNVYSNETNLLEERKGFEIDIGGRETLAPE